MGPGPRPVSPEASPPARPLHPPPRRPPHGQEPKALASLRPRCPHAPGSLVPRPLVSLRCREPGGPLPQAPASTDGKKVPARCPHSLCKWQWGGALSPCTGPCARQPRTRTSSSCSKHPQASLFTEGESEAQRHKGQPAQGHTAVRSRPDPEPKAAWAQVQGREGQAPWGEVRGRGLTTGGRRRLRRGSRDEQTWAHMPSLGPSSPSIPSGSSAPLEWGGL